MTDDKLLKPFEHIWTTKRHEYTLQELISRPGVYLIMHFTASPLGGYTWGPLRIEDERVFLALQKKLVAEGMVDHLPELKKCQEDVLRRRLNSTCESESQG